MEMNDRNLQPSISANLDNIWAPLT